MRGSELTRLLALCFSSLLSDDPTLSRRADSGHESVTWTGSLRQKACTSPAPFRIFVGACHVVQAERTLDHIKKMGEGRPLCLL